MATNASSGANAAGERGDGDGAGAKTPPTDPLPQIPEVTLLGEIARGGMGVVYRGRQEFLARDVAVKLLSPHLQGQLFLERFRREAQLLAGIKHPHIVACHTAGTTGSGQSYLVMEFVDGPSLKRWIDDHGAVPLPSALRLLRQLASALAHACDLGVIHRDVKPENILLDSPTSTAVDLAFPFVPKLVDLGLARMAWQSGDLALTAPGAVMGTPATMAPEQFDAPDEVDYRADIYGLGCVLYQMLTGAAPFASTKLTDIVVEKRQRRGPDPCARVDGLPRGVGDLVTSMLACAPADRPADYRVLLARLDELAAAAAAAPPSTLPTAAARTTPAPPAAGARGGPDLLRTAEFEFLAAGVGTAAADQPSTAFPDPTTVMSSTQLPPRAPTRTATHAAMPAPAPTSKAPIAKALPARRSHGTKVLIAGALATAAVFAAVPWLRQRGPDLPAPPSGPLTAAATTEPPATVAPTPREVAIELTGDPRPDAPIQLRAAFGDFDPHTASCRWTVRPATNAHIAAPSAPLTELQLDGLPGDTFALELEISAAARAPARTTRTLTLDYPPLDVFADFLARDSLWSTRPRPRTEWRLADGGGVFCLADDFPCLRTRPVMGAVWRLQGQLRPERGRRGFAQTAVCMRCGPAGQLAIVCSREGGNGERWSIALMEVDREDGRLGFQLRQLQQPKQVVAVDDRDHLGSATFTITRRGDELTFEFGFAGGESEQHRERLRGNVDNVPLTLFARGGRAEFPRLELW